MKPAKDSLGRTTIAQQGNAVLVETTNNREHTVFSVIRWKKRGILYFLKNIFLRQNPRPSTPAPNNIMLAGSGTSEANVLSVSI